MSFRIIPARFQFAMLGLVAAIFTVAHLTRESRVAGSDAGGGNTARQNLPPRTERPTANTGGRSGGMPADAYDMDTVGSLLALKNSLPAEEFSRRLQMACHRMKDGDPAAMRAALRSLPPGKDSRGAFNSLTYHFLQRDPVDGYKFLARLGKEGVFPEGWIWNAAETGVETMGLEDPHAAIRTVFANPEMFDTAIKQGMGAVDALSLYNRKAQPGDHELYAYFMAHIGKDARPHTQDHAQFWKFALGTPGVPDTALPAVDQLSKSNLSALGSGAARLPTLGDGLGALQRMGDPPAALRKFYGEWFERDVNHTLGNIDRIADPKVRDQILFDNIPRIGEWDKAASVQWANAIRDEGLRNQALGKVK